MKEAPPIDRWLEWAGIVFVAMAILFRTFEPLLLGLVFFLIAARRVKR